jgi:hypothetical protein
LVIFPWNRYDEETLRASNELKGILSQLYPVQYSKKNTPLRLMSADNLTSFKAALVNWLTEFVADVNRSSEILRELPSDSVFNLPPVLSPS